MLFFEKYRLWLLSLLSGLLFALSWPAGGIPMLIFIAFIPLLIVEEHIFTRKEQYGRFAVLIYAWFAFAVFNLFTTWWIFFASPPGMVMAVVLNSLLMAIAFYMMHLSRRVLPGKQGIFPLLIFWLSFEYLHLDWELSWSWLNLGNVFASLPRWVQWYEYTGTLGGTAWIIIMNICFFILYKSYTTPIETIKVQRNVASLEGAEKQRFETYLKNVEQFRLVKRRAFAGLFAFLFLVVPAAISFIIYRNYTLPNDPVEVVIVQDGRNPYLSPNSPLQARQWTDSIIMLAEGKITPETRFVITAEASLPGSLWLNNPSSHYGYEALKAHASRYDTLAWVAGVMMYRQYAENEEKAVTARKFPNEEVWYDFYNAALFVDSEGKTDKYFKSKLVPGIEIMPYSRYLRPIGNLVEMLGGTAGSMGVQGERGVFTSVGGTKVAPVICYESIYGNYLNDYIRKGAELIFIITNDGWWRDTPGHRQHNQYARLRAIETRRSVARAAKTGISGFIDPLGNAYNETQWNETTAIRNTVHKNSEMTFYVLMGDYLGRLSFFLVLLLLAYMVTQRVVKKKLS